MRLPHNAALALATLGLVSSAHCEEAPFTAGGRPGAGLATRSVSAYLGLEYSLEDAISQGDKETASGLLANGFKISSGHKELVARQEWLKREMARNRPTGLVRDLNVHEAPGLAVVTFLLDCRRDDGKGAVYSITDTWNSATHQLENRRAVEVKSPPPPLRRPTGRE